MPLILGTNSIKDTGYDVANSVRLDGSSAYMTRTMGTPTNTDKYTFSFWVKRSKLGSQQSIFRSTDDGTNDSHVTFQSDDTLRFEEYGGLSSIGKLQTTQKFRDVSAWFHIVLVYDSGNSTAGNRMRMYVNGTEVTSFGTDNNPSSGANSFFNKSGESLHFGRTSYSGGGNYFSGYLAEVVMCDGQALDPTSFGEFDSDSPNIWKPIDVSGLTFGNNGFYLDFEDSGDLGDDESGNGNDFTETNLAATDQSTDTCTNNFITLNPIITNTNRTNAQTYSEGNTISIPNSHDSYMTASSTIGLKGSGKWYWESQIVWNGTSSNAYYPRTIGFVSEDYPYSASYMGQADESWAIIYQASGGPGWRFGHDGSESDISGATSMANGDTMIFALDLDNGKFYAGRNGTWFTSADPTSGSTGTGALATLSASDLAKFLFPACTNASNVTYYKWNFGNPAYSISSSNSDGNGYGNFEYSVPSGYFSINTKNLAEYG